MTYFHCIFLNNLENTISPHTNKQKASRYSNKFLLPKKPSENTKSWSKLADSILVSLFVGETSVQAVALLHKQYSNFSWSFLKQEEISRSVISKGQIILITLQRDYVSCV